MVNCSLGEDIMKRLLLLLILPFLISIFTGCTDDPEDISVDDIVGTWYLDGEVDLTVNDCNFIDTIAKDARVFRIEKISEDQFKLFNCELDLTCATEEHRGDYTFGSELQMMHNDIEITQEAVSSCKVIFGGMSRLNVKDGTIEEAIVDVHQTSRRIVGEDITDPDAECAKLVAALQATLQSLEDTKDQNPNYAAQKKGVSMQLAIVSATTKDTCTINRNYEIKKTVTE